MNKVFIILEVVDLGDSIEGVYKDRDSAIEECSRLNEERNRETINNLMNMPTNSYSYEDAKKFVKSRSDRFYVQEWVIR